MLCAVNPPSRQVSPEPASAALQQEPEFPVEHRRGAFLLLFACLISMGMGQSLMFAVLPPVARNMGLSELQVGAIFAVSAVLWVIGSPYFGRRSDRWGRRPAIILGLTAYGVSMTAFGLAVLAGLNGWVSLLLAYGLMVFSRSIFGLFGSATVPAAQAYIADRSAPHERAAQLTTLTAAFGLGVTLGPGLVSLLTVFGLVAPFFGVALLGFISALVVALFLREQRPPREQRDRRHQLGRFDARIRPFLAVGIMIGVCQASTMQTAGFYAIDVLGISVEESARRVGIALMGTAGAALFSQLIIVRRLHPAPRTMMLAGASCGLLAFLFLILGSSYATLFAGLMLMGFTFGLVQPGAVTGASLTVGLGQQGAVTGIMATTGATGMIFAPFIGMPLYQWFPQAPYIFNLILVCLALAFVLVNPHIRRARPELHRNRREVT